MSVSPRKARTVAPVVAVRVREPYQVSFEGDQYGHGTVLDVDRATAEHWTRCGWADEVPDDEG